jgi:hypothetical protein
MYCGQPSKKGSHNYIVVHSTTDQVKKDRELIFGKRLNLSESIGSIIVCHTDNGSQFGSFDYADQKTREIHQEKHAESISHWSTKNRARMQIDAIDAAGKKEHPRHVSQIVGELAKCCKKLSQSEKIAIMLFVNSKILK